MLYKLNFVFNEPWVLLLIQSSGCAVVSAHKCYLLLFSHIVNCLQVQVPLGAHMQVLHVPRAAIELRQLEGQT